MYLATKPSKLRRRLRRRRGDRRRSPRANLRDRAAPTARSSRRGRRTSPSVAAAQRRSALAHRRGRCHREAGARAERGNGLEQPRRWPTEVTPRSFRSSAVSLAAPLRRSRSRGMPARNAPRPNSAASRRYPSFSVPASGDRTVAGPTSPAGCRSPSADGEHQVLIRRPGPHHIRLCRIGLGLSRIAIQHLGARADNHHVRARLDPIVAGLFFH